MSSITDGGEWEEYCLQLLWLRHGDDLQPIPAERKGDLGLEAFTRSSGLAYQCYFPLEPLTAKSRYEHQRDKLTEDLGKLEKRADELRSVLGATKICHYWFLVPLFDWPELLAHGEKHAAQLREKALDILDPNFTVGVQTDSAYAVERAQLLDTVRMLSLEAPVIAEEERVDWATAQENIGLVADLERKLAKLELASAEQDLLRNEMLGHYLASEDMLARVRDEAPEIWHRLDNRIRARERLLATERLLAKADPQGRLASTVESLADDLQQESSQLIRGDALAISVGTAAGWLLQCPLDF